MQLFATITVDAAWELLRPHLASGRAGVEWVDIWKAVGRHTAEPAYAAGEVPAFARSTVDGWAVRARDTFGASEGLPAFLTIGGEVHMGHPAPALTAAGVAVRIPTGGMLPAGSDAVVMVEDSEEVGDGTLCVHRPAAPGDNVVRAGEDLSPGTRLFPAGHRLRPPDVGALAAAGLDRVAVRAPLRVAVLSTGDEVAEPGTRLGPAQVHDVNGPALAAALSEDGAHASYLGIAPDEADAVGSRLAAALADSDMVLISGGSSVGSRDVVAAVIAAAGSPGVLAHGLAIKPGKPTLVAAIDGRAVFGLPGHPVSALVVYEVLVRQALGWAAGVPPVPRPRLELPVTRSLSSRPGREDYVRCAVERTPAGLVARPVLGKSGLISTLIRADGLIRIPESTGGYSAGDTVEVMLLRMEAAF